MTKGTGRRPPTRDLVAVALALAIGGATLALHRGPATLVAAAACPGALEGIAIALARLGRSVPLGLWLVGAHRILGVAAVAAFALLARQACGTWLPAAAAAVALAAQPAFAPQLSVFGPASVLVPTLVFLSLRRPAPALGADWRLSVGLVMTAAVAPGATLPLAVVAGGRAATRMVCSARRWRGAVLAIAALAAFMVALEDSLPGRPPTFIAPWSCLSLSWSGSTLSYVAAELRSMATSAGVFACSLATLGAFAGFAALRERGGLTALAYVVACTAAAMGGVDSARLLEPSMVAFWVLVAMGLSEAARACGARIGGRFAAVLLILLVPVLQISGRTDGPRDTRIRPNGHERLTLQGVAQALRIFPNDSAIVVEDATTDVFLRALDGTWQRAGKTLQLVPRRPAEIRRALDRPDLQVFALPAAQEELWRVGFRLTDGGLPDVSGVAEVRTGGACTVVDGEWRGLPDLSQSSVLSLVAEAETEEGPIVIYVASDQRPAVVALGWPPLTMRGFHERVYDRSVDASRLDADRRDDGVPDATVERNAPYVTRLELWRTPGAPRVLTVELGARPLRAIARLRPNAAVPHLMVCPAFPFTPRSLVMPR